MLVKAMLGGARQIAVITFPAAIQGLWTMMNICILQGHPHGTGDHFCHALADAYAEGAATAGASISRLDIARIKPLALCDPADFQTPPEGAMAAARQAVEECEHLVVVFPLWLGTMPALLKAFFEQLARADFAISQGGEGLMPEPRLRGRSAHVIVTMGMPALAYRFWFWNRGVGNLKHLILGLSGFRPVHQTLIGGMGEMSADDRARWLDRITEKGAAMR
ncbi:NAD(P)H-dependent oxidoreductase [Rhodobacteraceae bacterium NNCM2]|nr:NAD(P)H-dependent oxidoreductase [Coraliihabitans acroporae]